MPQRKTPRCLKIHSYPYHRIPANAGRCRKIQANAGPYRSSVPISAVEYQVRPPHGSTSGAPSHASTAIQLRHPSNTVQARKHPHPLHRHPPDQRRASHGAPRPRSRPPLPRCSTTSSRTLVGVYLLCTGRSLTDIDEQVVIVAIVKACCHVNHTASHRSQR